MTILHRFDFIAKKHHRCEECCGSINPGEKYHRIVRVFEGDLCIYRAHLPCREASVEANNLAKSSPDNWFFIHDIPQNELQFYPKAAAIFGGAK